VNLTPQLEQQLREIPMISEVATKLLNLTSDPGHSIREAVEIIETDVYLAARVLRVANSVAYSRGAEISTIQRAVMHLGETMVIGIAVGASTGQMLTRPLAGYDSPEGALWAHCLQDAIAAREVAKLSDGKVIPDHAYTAGLMLDIGMAVLSDFIAEDLDDLLENLDRGEALDFADAERSVTGIDHTVLGELLGRKWNLPDPLLAAIRYHHNPSEAPSEYRPLAYTVHVADLIIRSAGFGVGADALSYRIDEGYREYIALDRKRFEELLLLVMQEYTKIRQSFLAE
jgi:HD-like signal output (HDOD) protein